MRDFTLFIGSLAKDRDSFVKKSYINYIVLKIKSNILDYFTLIIDKFLDNIIYRNNNKNDYLDIVTFDFDIQLEYYNSSKEEIIEKFTKSISEKEKSKSFDKQNCQEELTHSFTIVELYTNTDYSSVIFDFFIILLSKYIFLLIYNYFHNANIVIFFSINFLIFYTTFRHALFQIMGGNYKK